MTTHSPTPPFDSSDEQLARLLDGLGQAERDSMPAGLTDRAWQASLASLHGVVETSARAAELGAMDRAAAGPELETRVHQSSRGALHQPSEHQPSLRLVGAERTGIEPGRRVVVRRTLAWRLSAVAAALLVVGAGAAVLMSQRTGTSTTEVASTDSIEAQLDKKMDTLLLAMQDVPLGAEDSKSAEFSPEWLDELSPTTPAASQRNGL